MAVKCTHCKVIYPDIDTASEHDDCRDVGYSFASESALSGPGSTVWDESMAEDG